MYILRNDKGDIVGYSTSQVNPSMVWTDEEVVEAGNKMFLASQTEEIANAQLEWLKTNKLAELKSIRDTQEVADIQVNGRLFDYDDKARERINAAIIALDLTGGTITWTLADNTDTEVSANDLRFVIAMVAQRSNVLHTQYRHLKEAVNAATTVSEVESISWPED